MPYVKRRDMPVPERECRWCGEVFAPRRENMVYCTARCQNRASLKKFREKKQEPA